jgi:hypothetical protein
MSSCRLTPRLSGRVIDKVPSSNAGVRVRAATQSLAMAASRNNAYGLCCWMLDGKAEVSRRQELGGPFSNLQRVWLSHGQYVRAAP